MTFKFAYSCQLNVLTRAGQACVLVQVKLLGPKLSQLANLLQVPLQPVDLLRKLSKRGVLLIPEDRDAQYVDMQPKQVEVERAMCRDISLLAGSHLISSSKWTQAVEVCVTTLKISE